jgi:hypothetical protein
MAAPFFAMLIALVTFCIFDWVRISIVEAGVITSILFSSWAGADHEILCCNLLSPLLCRLRHHMFAGSPHPTSLPTRCSSSVAPSTSPPIGRRLRRRRAPAATAGGLGNGSCKRRAAGATVQIARLVHACDADFGPSTVTLVRDEAQRLNSTDDIIRQMCLCCRIVSRCLR